MHVNIRRTVHEVSDLTEHFLDLTQASEMRFWLASERGPENSRTRISGYCSTMILDPQGAKAKIQMKAKENQDKRIKGLCLMILYSCFVIFRGRAHQDILQTYRVDSPGSDSMTLRYDCLFSEYQQSLVRTLQSPSLDELLPVLMIALLQNQ